MDTREITAQRSGTPSPRPSGGVGEVLLFTVSTGVAATMVAAACSLLVSGTSAKLLVWIVTALLVSVVAGLWRASVSVTGHQRGLGSLPPFDRRAGSPR